MVFRQLYETLIRLDCTGAPRPGLAASWVDTDSGRRWSFTLRSRAAFWDGQPVTARDVIASWTAGDTSLLEGARLEAPDDRTVVVRLAEPSAGWPQRLADPALVVMRSVAGREWPVGTGAYTADTVGGRVVVAPFAGAGRPVLLVHARGTGDARDWLDRGVDLLVTDDRVALSYAADRADFATAPLPWDRTYVLLARGARPAVSDAVRGDLARDALHVDARAASGAYWWEALPACIGPPPAGAAPLPPLTNRRVVYPLGDGAARELAGRLVALQGDSLRAAGLSDSSLEAALAHGDAAEYVVALPRASLDPCRDVRRLVARVPWIPLGAALDPLVDTRRHAIVRRTAAAAFAVDWDGVLRVR